MAKIVSLIVKAGGLIFILGFPQNYAIVLQLLGGIWISQTLPAVMLGLYTRWFHPWALMIGWLAGICAGTWMASALSFKSAIYTLHIFAVAVPCYAAISALALNLAVSVILSVVFNAFAGARPDETLAEDYV